MKIKRNPIPSKEELEKVLKYCSLTGIFTWKKNGKTAGTKDGKGYIRITYKSVFYGAHRLAWRFLKDEDPQSFEIDHINGNRSDNCKSNLRKATRQENNMNMKSRGAWPKGVYKHRNSFVAQIKFEGKGKYLGSFATPEEAHKAYRLKAEELFGDFRCMS